MLSGPAKAGADRGGFAMELTGKIQSAVAALARDLEPGELSLRLVAQEALSLALTVQHTATFATVTTPAAGPLPNAVRAVSSRAALQAELDQRVQTVRDEAGDLIDKWVTEHAGAYRSELSPERCMVDRPVLGVQETCGTCNGRRELTCGGCGGRGRVTCGSCGGRGRVTCSACGGSRATSCGSCHGSGSHEVREFEAQPGDRQNTMNQQNVLIRRVPCTGCGGRGSNPCSCGDGTQACTCTGGQVTCGGCGGRGIVPCGTCAATGVVNHTGRVRCTVDRGIRIEVGNGTPEDTDTFRDRVPFPELGAMAAETGGVRLQRQIRVLHQVTLDYAASVPLEIAEGRLHGASVTIRAYGPSREIYDYQQLTGQLLEPDLAALEKSLQGNALLALRSGASLAGATKTFLASEVNALIAEAAPQIRDGAVTNARRVSPGRVIGQTLLLKPVIRMFRASHLLFKVLMVVIGVGLASERPLLLYGLLALGSFYFEWRHQKNSPPEAARPAAASAADASAAERAAKALESPVAAGMVSARYVERASAAIGKAVPRLYGPLVVPMALWLTGGAAVVCAVAWRGLPSWPPLQRLLVPFVLTGVGWVVVELRAVSSLKKMLGPGLYARLKGQIGSARSLCRLLPVASFVLGLVLGDLLVRLIGYLRFR